MGWCATTSTSPHPLLAGIDDGSYFYYVHSYAVPLSKNTLATAQHTAEFSAVIGKENFVAAQFHPERSSKSGARLLRNFLDIPA
jgi:glutamine amidotransferase